MRLTLTQFDDHGDEIEVRRVLLDEVHPDARDLDDDDVADVWCWITAPKTPAGAGSAGASLRPR